jgi:hypothetical protein
LVSEQLKKVAEKVCYSLVPERGFDIEPRWASGVVFAPRMRREIGFGRSISDPGLLQMSRSYLMSFKLRRYSGVMKPQPVGYKSTGREDSTP